MNQVSSKCQNPPIVLILTLLIVLGVFGEGEDYEDGRPKVVRLGEEEEARIVGLVVKELNEAQVARETRLNRTLDGMQKQIKKFFNANQSPNSNPAPAPAPALSDGNNRNRSNNDILLMLEKEINALKNQRGVLASPRALAQPPAVGVPLVEIPALQTELRDLRYRLDTLNSSLSNQNQEKVQNLVGNVTNLTKAVKGILDLEKEKKRTRIVQNIVQAFGNSEHDQVRSLLNELTKLQQLSSSMADIVRGMFVGDIANYSKIIAFFQSAKRGQYKFGLASLIKLFNDTRSSGAGTLNSNSNSSTRSLVDEPKYLHLAYLAKREFGNDLKSKFVNLVQNLVFKDKACFRNQNSNSYLFMDSDKVFKDGAFSVSSRKRNPSGPSSGFCDWEILPLSEATTFIIRQKDPNPGGSHLNLNVLNKSVFAGTVIQNSYYQWNLALRNNAGELTLKNVPGSSDQIADFLCVAAASGGRTGRLQNRAVEMLNDGSKGSCAWYVDP